MKKHLLLFCFTHSIDESVSDRIQVAKLEVTLGVIMDLERRLTLFDQMLRHDPCLDEARFTNYDVKFGDTDFDHPDDDERLCDAASESDQWVEFRPLGKFRFEEGRIGDPKLVVHSTSFWWTVTLKNGDIEVETKIFERKVLEDWRQRLSE